MIIIRHGRERGHFDHGWLDTYHTFSFGDYRDPRYMGFRSLRVINEDRVQPGQGFGLHPHRDMEIITYVLAGALEHRDSLGNGAVLRPGQVQYMAAGTGIQHSEFNPSATEAVHLVQIWITPEQRGAAPRYEQRDFPGLIDDGRLTLLTSRTGREESIAINQDADLYAATLRPGSTLVQPLNAGRAAWVQVLRGKLGLDGVPLSAGDGAAVTDQPELSLSAEDETELLLFDLQ
jgi:redox-sensitive bicupin YhaK (pirin superfamily)